MRIFYSLIRSAILAIQHIDTALYYRPIMKINTLRTKYNLYISVSKQFVLNCTITITMTS